jgi:hypothetical protein
MSVCRINLALALDDLLARIERGQEYPDAHSAVAVLHKVDGDELRDAYDEHCAGIGRVTVTGKLDVTYVHPNIQAVLRGDPDHEGGID